MAAFAGCLVAACARGDAPVTPLPAGTTVYAFRNHVDNVFGATLGAEGNLYLALYYPSAIALFAPERKTYRRPCTLNGGCTNKGRPAHKRSGRGPSAGGLAL